MFSYYLENCEPCGEKVVGIKCVILSAAFVWFRYVRRCNQGMCRDGCRFSYKVFVTFFILTIFGMCQQIVVKLPDIRFHENPSRISLVILNIHTYRLMEQFNRDMKVPKEWNFMIVWKVCFIICFHSFASKMGIKLFSCLSVKVNQTEVFL
jgi:hypothetical protein